MEVALDSCSSPNDSICLVQLEMHKTQVTNRTTVLADESDQKNVSRKQH